jgi:hypothetical protein
MSHTLD